MYEGQCFRKMGIQSCCRDDMGNVRASGELEPLAQAVPSSTWSLCLSGLIEAVPADDPSESAHEHVGAWAHGHEESVAPYLVVALSPTTLDTSHQRSGSEDRANGVQVGEPMRLCRVAPVRKESHPQLDESLWS